MKYIITSSNFYEFRVLNLHALINEPKTFKRQAESFLKSAKDNNDAMKAVAIASATTLWPHLSLSIISDVIESSKQLGNVFIVVTVYKDVFLNIGRWMNGEITGQRCLKSIIDCATALAGSTGGAVGGAAMGTLILPGPGTVIGGLIGGLLGGTAAGFLSKWLTEYIFDLGPHVALDKAYEFLGVSHHCSNHEMNQAYHRLARVHHPDKGGNVETFQKLNYHVAIIKAARENT
jgi:hypothetical protein